VYFRFFSELSRMVCNAKLCAMLNVEKEVPGRPNNSFSSCPSPSSLSLLLAPDSPISSLPLPLLSYFTLLLSPPSLISDLLITAKGPGSALSSPVGSAAL